MFQKNLAIPTMHVQRKHAAHAPSKHTAHAFLTSTPAQMFSDYFG